MTGTTIIFAQDIAVFAGVQAERAAVLDGVIFFYGKNQTLSLKVPGMECILL